MVFLIISDGSFSGLTQSPTIFLGIMTGILSCISASSPTASLVSTTNTGRSFSILYSPHSQVMCESTGCIVYYFPTLSLPP